jgi:hypothetical protein
MQIETMTNTATASLETADRATWNTPHIKAVSIEDRTQGAFIPGPAEIPSLCS